MLRLLSRLSARDWAIVCGGLALVVGLEMAKPLEETAATDPGVASPATVEAAADRDADDAAGEPRLPEPVLHPREQRRTVRDVARLTPETRAAMDAALEGAPYFAAFAAGAVGRVQGYANPEAARAAALAECAQHGPDCAIVAEVLPAGDIAPGPDSLNWLQGEAWRSSLRAHGSRAFARSVDGAWAAATGPTGAAAAAIAVRLCEDSRSPPPHLPPMPCEALGIWQDGVLQPRR